MSMFCQHFTQGFRGAESEVWMLSGPGQWACNDNSFVQDLDTNWGALSCVTALNTAVIRTPGLLIDLGIGLFDCPVSISMWMWSKVIWGCAESTAVLVTACSTAEPHECPDSRPGSRFSVLGPEAFLDCHLTNVSLARLANFTSSF